jgi:hypothetical protein
MVDAVQKLYFTYCIKSCPVELQKVQERCLTSLRQDFTKAI